MDRELFNGVPVTYRCKVCKRDHESFQDLMDHWTSAHLYQKSDDPTLFKVQADGYTENKPHLVDPFERVEESN